MSLSDLCTNFISSAKLKDETDRNIIEFAEAPWGLGMGSIEGVPPLLPVQKFILKCYYNIPLSKGERNIRIMDRFNEQERYRFNEVEYFNYLVDEHRINIKQVTGDPKDSRPNLLLVIGRRGTKTSTIAIIAAFETYKLLKKYFPQQYYKIMPEDEIWISCISTREEQSADLFRRITGHLERSEYFNKFRNKPTLGYMQLSSQRDIDVYGPGIRPSIRIVASPCSSRGLRGHNNIVAILDEMAYFFESDASFDRSDEAIYDAVTPSVAKFNSPEGEPHGRIICISSPAARSGKFYRLYERSFEPDCSDLLMIQAPTWEVDYTLSSKFLRSKYSENPITYMVEYGAEFSDRVSGWIENEQILRANIVPGLRLKKMSYERVPHFMGIDLGMKNDGTAIAICHVVKKESEGILKDFIELDAIDVRYPSDEDKDHFRAEEMVEWIASFFDKFFIVKGMTDQYLSLALIPLLHDKGLKQIEAVHVTRDLASRIYQNLMSKMLDASLRIPEDEEHESNGKKTKDIDLVRELLTLQATVHSKYLISVGAPDIKGMHDDLSDAFARAVYLASEYIAVGGDYLKTAVSKISSNSASSYHKYLIRKKNSALYNNRSVTPQQMSLMQGRHLTALLDRISTLGRISWR